MGRKREQRAYTFEDFEFRTVGDTLKFSGHAAVFDQLSERMWGFREKVATGAFEKTIKESDVRFLAQHDPATVMARTKSGSLTLAEDKVGLRTDADLNRRDPDVQRLEVKMRDGNIDQMSFGFITLRDEWAEEVIDQERQLVRTLVEVRLFDVSPVTFPAYPQTDAELDQWLPAEIRAHADRMLDEHRTAIASHSTAVEDSSWDGPAAVKSMDGKAELRYCHAWFEGGDADPEAKTSYKFPHHRTKGGPAILNGVRNGMSRLSGANIPDGDRSGVEKHLQTHLDAADRALELDGAGLAEALYFVASAGLAAGEFERVMAELRTGKVLSSKNKAKIQSVIDALGDLLADADPQTDSLGLDAQRRRRQLELLRNTA